MKVSKPETDNLRQLALDVSNIWRSVKSLEGNEIGRVSRMEFYELMRGLAKDANKILGRAD